MQGIQSTIDKRKTMNLFNAVHCSGLETDRETYGAAKTLKKLVCLVHGAIYPAHKIVSHEGQPAFPEILFEVPPCGGAATPLSVGREEEYMPAEVRLLYTRTGGSSIDNLDPFSIDCCAICSVPSIL